MRDTFPRISLRSAALQSGLRKGPAAATRRARRGASESSERASKAAARKDRRSVLNQARILSVRSALFASEYSASQDIAASCLGAFRPPPPERVVRSLLPAAENLHRSRHYVLISFSLCSSDR